MRRQQTIRVRNNGLERRLMKGKLYDCVVVGAGPAGLSTAINTSSEGLGTLVLDAAQLGGQAGTSTLIKNYPGFLDGIPGGQLTATMVDQARTFGTTFIAPARITSITCGGDRIVLMDDEGEEFHGLTTVYAGGVQYRKLHAENLAAYLGRGVTYGSPSLDRSYRNGEYYVVGGANSAGQAAIYLAQCPGCIVHIVVRGDSLEARMSDYLVKQIAEMPNITVHTRTEVDAVNGNGKLDSLVLNENGTSQVVTADGLFVLIGAQPKTNWLEGILERESHGFVVTGGDLSETARAAFVEGCGGQPFANETAMPYVFAAGDVRSGTTKRVVAAAGDGGVIAGQIHRALARRRNS